MYLLDSNCTDAMTQESISGWQAYSNIPGGRPGTKASLSVGCYSQWLGGVTGSHDPEVPSYIGSSHMLSLPV